MNVESVAVEVSIFISPFTAVVAISIFVAFGATIINLASGSVFLRMISMASGATNSSISIPGPKTIPPIALAIKDVKSKPREAGIPAIAMACNKMTLGKERIIRTLSPFFP